MRRIVYAHLSQDEHGEGRCVWANLAPLPTIPPAPAPGEPLFAWGQSGHAAQRLARCILYHLTGNPTPDEALVAAFVEDHVRHWPDLWRITSTAVARFLLFRARNMPSPSIYWDAPPDPPPEILDWIDMASCEYYLILAVAAHNQWFGLIETMLHLHKLPTRYAERFRCDLPGYWRTEVRRG